MQNSGDVKASRREWFYIDATIAAFVFIPELRRLQNWGGHYSSVDILSPLPLVMLLPIAFVAFRRRKAIARTPFSWIIAAWALSLFYGFLVGIAQRVFLAGLYDLALFMLPVSLAAWTLSLNLPADVILRRISRSLLLFGGMAGVYGVVQFLFAPPWDTAWMISTGETSFGEPVKYGIRVFSVMNGPGVFANFLAIVLILTVATLDLRRPLQLLATLAMLVSLLLTLVRSSWLELVVGLIALMLFHPSRLRSIWSLMSVFALATFGISVFLAISPDETFKGTLFTRFSTFSNISEDGSAIAREASSEAALQAALTNPLGSGLGLTGTANRLVDPSVLDYQYSASPAIDNGYLCRLFEQGIPGFTLFIVTLLSGLYISVTAYARARHLGRQQESAVVAICLALQLGTFGTLAGGDVLQGIGGMMYFFMLAISARVYTTLENRDVISAQMIRRSALSVRPLQLP